MIRLCHDALENLKGVKRQYVQSIQDRSQICTFGVGPHARGGRVDYFLVIGVEILHISERRMRAGLCLCLNEEGLSHYKTAHDHPGNRNHRA
jgi:hypothetical protein